VPDDSITGNLNIKAVPLRRLYRDWSERCGARRMPARADFDPLEMRYILSHLSLVDVLRNPLRFVFRLHASNNAARVGVDMTGKEIGEMPLATAPEQLRAQYEVTVRSRAPVVHNYHATLADGLRWDYELLLLPLAADGETVDMVMAGMAWTPR
jgi:hypothetical protein